MQRLVLILIIAFGFLDVHAQQRMIKGTVTDENNQPLPGATVRVKASNVSAVTDATGNFQINVGEQAAPVLIVSYIGYTEQEVPVSGPTVSVRLEQGTRALNDIVVVGYGTQRKRDVTGATSTVKSEEIAKRPLVRVEQALQGTTSGVQVASSSGQPGKGLSVRIRGVNSITGSNEPLYVIDGYIGGSIESVNPNDIENIEILKDASATAIYGSRGSNGVVLISTKGGKEGKTHVDFSTWFSKASVPKQLDIMNAYDFARTVNKQNLANGGSPAFNDQELEGLRTGGGGTDWQKELQQQPWIQNYQLSVSGGNKGVKYLFSFNHLDQPGLIKNQYYKRTTLRSNVDVKLNDKMDLKMNVNAVFPQDRNIQYPGDLIDPFTQATEWDPTSPVKDANGNYILSAQFGSIQINPVAQAMNQAVDNSATNLAGTGVFTWRILKNLTFTSNNTYEVRWILSQQLFGKETSLGMANRDNATSGSTRFRAYQNSNFLTYKNDFGDHSLTVTALYEQQNQRNITNNAQGVNLASYSLGYYNVGLGKTQFATSGYWADALQSYMGRVNYAYKNKYLLTAAIRVDGSSHLLTKYSTFPSLALGWNIANEGFMKDNKLFSDLKLRASYGVTGNQAVAPYATIQQISTGQPYYFDGATPSTTTPFGGPVSKSLKWERTEQYDAGLDAAFLQGRLTFAVDAYYKKIKDLLYNYQTPFYNSGLSYARNIGSVENRGIEFALGGTPVTGGKFKWTSNLIASVNRNKITELGGLDNILVNNIGSPQTNLSILRVGQPLGSFYGYQFLGTWKSKDAAEAAQYGMKPGDAKYVDVNNDKKYDAADQMIIGNGTPKFTFGFINDINYGNFTLSVMLQGATGYQIFSQTLAYMWGGVGDARNATTKEALDMWTPERETDVPAFSATTAKYNNSSRFVYDASYMKLKNLSLTYHIPDHLLSKIKLRNLEVYVSGQNLFVVTSYPGYDPEISNATNAITQGLEMGVIPNPRTYTFGLRAGF
ncbi:TonB-dependent receptor [Chitinophaga agrisoli]|uniref:TonB-dependent receptor n=1 Tax=Chitinophaga agrisoli TaxID=2607653 RepID=A0A5B2VXQ9_9BACT|nr:TonB-dependent receptor [Chitinophaga agrisoli]KAA2243604.1 TonB-dependent receptor [Chitinophaga agrisoli]